jgi:hypothetical protein
LLLRLQLMLQLLDLLWQVLNQLLELLQLLRHDL